MAESRRISESIRLSEEESQNLSLTSDPAENSQSVVETTPNVGEDPTEPSRTTEEPYDPNRPQQMVWPLPAWSYISSAYGMRIHPISGRKAGITV